jgi:adenylosuccinate lyase
MDLSELTAISPIDGRYRSKLAPAAAYFSEYALMRYRLLVEVEYLISLITLLSQEMGGSFTAIKALDLPSLRKIYSPEVFTLQEAEKIKAHEKVTNHDVKAVEYYLKDHISTLSATDATWELVKEYIHFGLTSQDINNVAIPLLLKDSLVLYQRNLDGLVADLTALSKDSFEIPMLARTHGQPATPTTLGKEIYVWVYRLTKQIELLQKVPHSGKFGGATGQFNAHAVAFPKINFLAFGDSFVSSLGLEREQWTTQIANYDNLAALFDAMARINTILLDASKDFWQYISMEYFGQRVIANEVGSSAMPHKVNPIDFENAEGNLGMANALFHHLSSKLPVSRLQRDLTDSTVLRNIGVPFSHTLLAFQSFKRGLSKLMIRRDVIKADLEDNFVVISEAIQTILRRIGYPKPYEAVKALTRTGGSKVTEETLKEFVDGLVGVEESVKAELRAISPQTYIGQFPPH